MRARVIKSARRTFDCLPEGGSEAISATAKGNLLKEGEVVVGDYVELEESAGEWVITEVEERKNRVFRRIIREQKEKTIASNLDLLVIVCAVSKPNYKRGLLDRYLIRSEQWEIPAIIVFNKMDQFTDQFDREFEKARVASMDIPFFETCAKRDEASEEHKDQLEKLKETLKGKTSMFVGQSGVGKSKLISTLTDGAIDLESRELAKVGKGTHTTTWAELIHYKDFEIIDSPGVRTLSIEDIFEDELPHLFPDLVNLLVKCQFNNCKHQPDSKGCYFQEDIPNKEYILSRLDSYLRFKEEVSRIPDWEK